MLFLLGADISKYRSKIEGLHTQKNIKNDQYPKTLDDAIFAIGRMKFDKEYYDLHKKRQEKEKKNKKNEKEEEDTDIVDLSFAQIEEKCDCCRQARYKSPQCKHKNRPREKWVIHKAKDKPSKTSSTQQQQDSDK